MLTDTGVRAAAAKAKPYKLADGGGLHVLVTPAGGKLWRLKYRFSGKEKLLAFGAYPTVSLRDARGRRDDAKKLLAAGLDPSAEKRKADLAAVVSSANTFDSVAGEYITKRRAEGLADATHKKLNWYRTVLNRAIGTLPVSTITPSDLLAALSKVQDSGKRATAHSLRGFAGSVFRYAIVTGRANRDPAADLKGALLAPRVQPRAALLEPKQIGALLRAIDGYEGQPETRHALQLLPHVFLRPGELRMGEWREIDLEGAVWRVPAAKTKMRRDHKVPLSAQAVVVLRALHRLTGRGKYVFPSIRSATRPMSNNTLNAALRRLGYAKDEMTAHGFRSTASTRLNECAKWSVDAIERALAHGDKDAIRAAYDRGDRWDERVAMMQWWSDYLDQLKRDDS